MSDNYHQMPGLSSSGARKLLPPSCPAKFKYELDNPPPPRDVFDMGHVAHRLVLGEGEDFDVIVAPDWRSKPAREARDAARDAGRVPILQKDYETCQAMAEQVHQHPVAAKLFAYGKAEVIKHWTDEQTGTALRTKFDWLPNNLEPGDPIVIPDYKTAASAEPGKFARAAFDYGYHIQAAWYVDTILAEAPDADVRFVFVVQEKTAPYLVTVVGLDDVALDIGRSEYRKAIDLYAECAATDTWPGYADDTVTIETPSWALNKWLNDTAPADIQVA